MYPENDNQFEETTIKSVEEGSVTFADGWSIGIPDDCEVNIEPGMEVRMYGRGTGYVVRGLFIGGKKIWYRTEEEQKTHDHEQTYGKDAQEILDRWDNNEIVWSCEMGGLGPGYEQAIQITAFEILRCCLTADYTEEDYKERWDETRKEIETLTLQRLDRQLGLSGAQWGAALNLGVRFHRSGPQAYDSIPEDRKIQVSKHIPSLKEN